MARKDCREHFLLFPEMGTRVFLPEMQERPGRLRWRLRLTGGDLAQASGLHETPMVVVRELSK